MPKIHIKVTFGHFAPALATADRLHVKFITSLAMSYRMTAERVQLKKPNHIFYKIVIKGSRCNKKVMFLITFYIIKACLEGFTSHPF
jgi:hypothetical protein